jgi:Uncharacterized protein conserved in bacteria (DUF2252)
MSDAPGPQERMAAGKAARKRVPRRSLGEFRPAAGRDPVGLLLSQDTGRVAELVPVRYKRMLLSPLAYYRGAALPMAADLAAGPSPGLTVQLCGDAHLSNFGGFGSPERRLIFDVNDFDETMPGPFDWDVKRLVASLVLAGRENGLGGAKTRRVAVAAAAAYRTAMREFAGMPTLDVWYARLDVQDLIDRLSSQLTKRELRDSKSAVAKAQARDNTQAVAKLTRVGADGQREIVGDPPLIVPIEDLAAELDPEAAYAALRKLVRQYGRTLPPDRQHLLSQYRLSRVARKAVGVGSVGTRCWIVLMEASDGTGPLLLQAKQAQLSVLSGYAGESRYGHQGERVVNGQRLTQAASDIFLGWQRTPEPGGGHTDYYVRQLRDWKYSAPVGQLKAKALASYGQLCAWTLARGHARTGDRLAIAAYLGRSAEFDEALAGFGEAYADQTERDRDELAGAAAAGRVPTAGPGGPGG